ncbi:DUF3320 domain-containing protein [Phosphitispora fastidiosa]|uniref:DUF3320 domain-containing protein n=1 Tax=Phosphitispora fastidiosa TaxID=2837202 RepID=UPI001E2FD62C|nr:DUF3320 domain-containing protein [Phosphitispora fastidiosa]MBU7005980.1 very-short-patch-repair endonuclease [Phosphitispora fastidiosa]
MDEGILVEGSFSDVVNFAMQQNYVPIIKKLTVKNLREEDIRDIDIEITVEPEFAHQWTMRIEVIPGLQAVELGPLNIKLSPVFLYSLTEKMSGTVFVEVKHGESLLASVAHDIGVLAFNEWSGSLIMPEIICAFITPNHPKVTEIIMKSKPILQEWCGSPSFTGYQSNNINAVKMQMAAIYAVLQKENITYCMPPASYESIGQRVRLCDTVLSQKMGTCLDLSLLYASCLEAVGLNPLVIFLKGHAFAGCWLEDQCFAECVQDDVSLVTKRIAEGINEICLVEATCYVAGKTMTFEDAVKEGKNNLTDVGQFDFLVDVKRSRGSGIRPIPLLKTSDDGRVICDEMGPGQTSSGGIEDLVNVPEELEVFEKIKQVDHLDLTRQQIWERKLLDLSLRNTLVNFRVTKTTIQLMVSQLGELEDELAGGQEFQIMAKPRDWNNTLRDAKIFAVENQASALDSLSRTEFANRRIRTFIEENEVAYRVTNLYRQAKLSLEENGTNTLFLALGFLKWYESEVSEKARYAPVVLIPVEIVRKSAQKGYVIRSRDEEPQMNITLLEMLRQDFGLTIGGLDPLPTDASGIDLKMVFNIIRQAVMGKSRWDVEEFAFIGLFSFSRFIMWNDIRNRSDDLKENKVVASLLSGKMEWIPNEDFPSPDTLDDVYSPQDLAVPINADSSQLSAIAAAGRENSFVLHGPPGTGKSQTITNIIANALFQGKSVLFIAEKMAALSVVQKRLESIGLAPFCLELHSNKARKKDVLEQLEKVLTIGKYRSPQEYESQANRLHGLRKKLNSVVAAVHQKRHFGFSLYDAITCFEQYRDYADCIKFTREQIKTLTPEKYTLWVDLAGELKTAGLECGGAACNPLSAFAKCSYSQSIKDEIRKDLKNYVEATSNLQDGIMKLGRLLGLEKPLSYRQLRAFIDLITLLNITQTIPGKLFAYQELSLLQETVAMVCEEGGKRNELQKQLLSEFSEAILSFDAETAMQQWRLAETKWFLPKLLGQNKVAKSLKVMAKNPGEFKKEKTVVYMNLVLQYKAKAKAIDEQKDLFNELFGLLWHEGRADWTAISETYAAAVKGNALISAICNSSSERQAVRSGIVAEVLTDLTGFRHSYGDALKSVAAHWDRIKVIEDNLSQKAGIEFDKLRESADWPADVLKKAGEWLENLENLRNWCTYLSTKAKVSEAGLSNLILAYESGQASEEELLPVFYRGVSHACAVFVVEEEKCLSDFNGAVFENEISKYKQTCADYETLTKYELISRLSAKIPATPASFANSSEIGILQKAIRSGGRMLSIRKLFDGIPNLLRRLCPCMLMSPISVAQYIDPQYPQFDLIVFDEASQMPTCEAVGAMARGSNVIVVGDPKQLPPTNFFNPDRVDEDNYEKEDLESILDDCLALSMPQQHLRWHYRSRHESLIAFSNIQYYGNLFTFPSPNDLVSCVKYVPVEGYYDRGKTKQNRAEAEAVTSEIIRRLSDPLLCEQSIGVVTFNSVQQNLIDDLLVEVFAKNPELEEINNRSYEPIFVKNLENVQGDERDVILFSVGYGPDASGKVTLNFGPVNREGGWRRLNVAVSRARNEMMVFSTLRPEQIDLSKTRSLGVEGLKAFLEYAQKGKSALAAKASNMSVKKGITEKLIAEKIRKLGYEVKTNIGCSGYKIDIAIVHPDKKDEYILGIMCDGKTYHSANTARDRNILQSNVLQSLGWNIYRLWILDWWENQDRELEKIRTAVEQALINKEEKPMVKATPETIRPVRFNYADNKAEPPAKNTPVDENVRYEVCVLQGSSGGVDEFYLPQNNGLIQTQIEQVLEVEAPVSKNLLCRRVLGAWDIARLGTRLEKRFEEFFRELKLKKNISHNVAFYWNSSQVPAEYTMFRVPASDATRRNMEDLCSEEIANAIKHILKSQVSILKPDLIREVYKIFGFSRGSASIEKIISVGLKEAVKRNYVVLDGADRVIIKG